MSAWAARSRAEGLLLQITEKDEAVLEYLIDIRSETLTGEDECGFRICFEFADNPFFEDTLLVSNLTNSHVLQVCNKSDASLQTLHNALTERLL